MQKSVTQHSANQPTRNAQCQEIDVISKPMADTAISKSVVFFSDGWYEGYIEGALMEWQANEAETLIQLLEEVRLMLASSLPVDRAPRKQLSWDDVLPKPTHTTTAGQGIRGRSRLSDQYTRALRALRLSSH